MRPLGLFVDCLSNCSLSKKTIKGQTFGLPFYCFLDKLFECLPFGGQGGRGCFLEIKQQKGRLLPLSLRTGGRGEAVRFVRGLFK